MAEQSHAGDAATLTALYVNARVPVRPLKRAITLFGAGDGSDVVLSSTSVSETHAAVIRCVDGWFIADLSGLADTRVNGVVSRWRRLKPGDEVSLGRFRFRFDGPAISAAARTPGALVLLDEISAARHVAHEPLIVIGAAWFCDRVVQAEGLSPVEALLVWSADGPMLRAVGRSGRVTCNGQSVSEIPLSVGDRIGVGEQHWRFEVEPRVGAAARMIVPPAPAVAAAAIAAVDRDASFVASSAPAVLTLSPGLFEGVPDDESLGDATRMMRAGLPRLDALTHTDKLDQLIAGRLPADLRPAPVLHPAVDDPAAAERAALEIDDQMSRDLQRLERVQHEVARAARRVAEAAPGMAEKPLAGARGSEIQVPVAVMDVAHARDEESRRGLRERTEELLRQRSQLDARQEQLRLAGEELEQRHAVLEIRARQVRDAEQRVEAERQRVRQRDAEMESFTLEAETLRRASERERQEIAAESARLTDRARLLAETQVQADRVAAELDAARAAMAAERAELARQAGQERVAAAARAEAERQGELDLQRRREGLEAERGRLESAAAGLAERAARLEQRAADSETREVEYRALRAAIDHDEAEQTARMARLDEREESLLRREAEIAQRHEEASHRGEALNALRAELSGCAESLAEREARAAETERAFAQRAEELEHRQSEAERRSAEQAAHDEQLSLAQHAIEEQRAALNRREAELAERDARLAEREARLTEDLLAAEAQLTQSEDHAANVADHDVEIEQHRRELESLRTGLDRQRAALEDDRREVELSRQQADEMDRALALRASELDAAGIQLQKQAEAVEQRRVELDQRAEQMAAEAAALDASRRDASDLAEHARRLEEQEARLRRDAEAYEVRVGELVRQEEALESQRVALRDEAAAQQRRRDELEAAASERLSALEQSLAARREEIEAALEARRQEDDAALVAARRDLDERAAELDRERAALLAEREQLASDRAADELHQVIGEIAPPRGRDEAETPPLAPSPHDLDERQSRLDARAAELESQAHHLEDDWQRFTRLQAEFDAQQRAWAEQREVNTAALDRQRVELADTQRALDARAIAMRELESALAQPAADGPSAASDGQRRSAASAVPGARSPLSGKSIAGITAMTILGLVLGYYWPGAVREVQAELRAVGPVGAGALRRAEQELWSRELLDAAAARLKAAPDLFDKLWQEERLDTQTDPRGRRLLLRATVARGDVDQAALWLGALTGAFRDRGAAGAASGPAGDAVLALRTRRDGLAESLQRVEQAAARADAELAADKTEAELRQLRARMDDAKSQVDKARGAAEAALAEWNRVQQMTAADAARVLDPKRLQAALAGDATLSADRDQLRAQAQLLQTEMTEADKSVRGLLERLPAAVAAADQAAAEAGRAADQPDVGAALDQMRRQLADHKSGLNKFGSEWKARGDAAAAWKDGDDVAALLAAQHDLEERAESLVRRGAARLEAIRDVIDGLGNGAADTARREVMKGSLHKAFLPVQENYRDLVLAASGVSGAHNRRTDAARRSIVVLSQRVKGREAQVEASVAQAAREEWRTQHNARVASAQQEASQAASRRERLEADLAGIQSRISDLVSRNAGLRSKREDVRKRYDDVDRLKKQIADLDARIAQGVRPAVAAADHFTVVPARELPMPLLTRIGNSLLCGGVIAILGWLAVPVLQIARFFGGRRARMPPRPAA